LYWSESNDLFHWEFAVKRRWNLADVNFFRACAEFAHSQFSFVDRSAYSYADIERLIVLNPELATSLFELFRSRFDPEWDGSMVDEEALQKKIRDINSGMAERDILSRNIFQSILNFVDNMEKCNFFVIDKGALAFRLKPDFMDFYDSLSAEYRKSFPADSPYGVFFFYRRHAAGFQVRFSEIARGGWRTVIPRIVANELERTDYFEAARDEFFREVFVLAHTQHSKNKDIFEGGSKMITLLKTEGKGDWHCELWEAQKAIFAAFLSLINYKEDGTLRDDRIIDFWGSREIVEIGPDENMFDNMIGYMGEYGARAGYTLGSGIISGKPECGINHKEYGVTSFGVHEYFLRTMKELGIDPRNDDFSIKISGGPFGDVAGNMMKLLLRKENGNYAYPGMRIIAVTDGPAALFDPAGIDREELSKLVLAANLDKFDPLCLKGEGGFIVYSTPLNEDGAEYYRQILRRDGKNVELKITRDEFMGIFQSNLHRYADVFVPCGGRPSTVNINNWQDFANGEGRGCRAIVEGANSFLTPAARIELQKSGILNVKDASANKCGV
ncbi:MAG: NAD-glutamate dehydrogenase, partial [Lentisphaeria bacterium]|nr:NAD-glutamate dehydrogenase [Lentisphaeria bacterium]